MAPSLLEAQNCVRAMVCLRRGTRTRLDLVLVGLGCLRFVWPLALPETGDR